MLELIIFCGIQGLGAGFIFANIFTSVADVFLLRDAAAHVEGRRRAEEGSRVKEQ